MADDIFSQLIDLFNQPGPVNWKLAREVANQLAGGREPIDPWLAEEYQELVRLAQLQVQAASNLPLGPALDAVPVDRATWAERNLQSFRYIVEPLAGQFDTGGDASDPMSQMLKPLGPALLGLQMGTMIGFLSHRILGQFDLGLPTAEQGDLLLVVPNIEAFATDHNLDARQVRLWIALHEVTHQAEFSVPWVRGHFFELVDRYLSGVTIDPGDIMERIQDFSDPAKVEEMMGDPAGLSSMFSTDEQRPTLDAIQAFMALMEGYGDFLMDRAAPKMLPDLDRMRAAMQSRRDEPRSGAEQLLHRLLGLELKAEQYRIGGQFCVEVERRWGRQALDQVWDEPDHLPTLSELADPVAWAARVLLPDF
ncbi:MAG: zinc-dependent metalloprotease [Acidimicrobiia bacterium]|nr:zinc-dependent metalloprotease [Acidimicrobiia bacterium]